MGKRVLPHIQRYRADDLMTSVFPAQTQCFEHRSGDLELPKHPLVRQTMQDCCQEAMDLERLLGILAEIKAGEIKVEVRDCNGPSPFAYDILLANPYAFLDGAALEDRRTRALDRGNGLDSEQANDLTIYSDSAIALLHRSPLDEQLSEDDLIDVMWRGAVWDQAQLEESQLNFTELLGTERIISFIHNNHNLCCVAELVPMLRHIFPPLCSTPLANLVESQHQFSGNQQDAQKELMRGILAVRGLTAPKELLEELGLDEKTTAGGLSQLLAEGSVFHITKGPLAKDGEVWCEKSLLLRAKRQSLSQRRSRIEAKTPAAMIQFLWEWHGQGEHSNTDYQSFATKLEGFVAPAYTWENEIFATRDDNLASTKPFIDNLGSNWSWCPLFGEGKKANTTRRRLSTNTPVFFYQRRHARLLCSKPRAPDPSLSLSNDQKLTWEALKEHGAVFIDELQTELNWPLLKVSACLVKLVQKGCLSCDAMTPNQAARIEQYPKLQLDEDYAYQYWLGRGRISLMPNPMLSENDQALQWWAKLLLLRYGVVFRELLARERLAPSWSKLRTVYRRMEMRGELYCGRIISGNSYEQFALPEAIEALDKASKGVEDSVFRVIATSDPINLWGIIDGSQRLPAVPRSRLVFYNGRVLAQSRTRRVSFFSEVDASLEPLVIRALALNAKQRRLDPFVQLLQERRPVRTKTHRRDLRSFLDQNRQM